MRRKPAGRPLRFFLLLSLGWIALRAIDFEARTPAAPAVEPASTPQLAAAPLVQPSALTKPASFRQTATATAPILLTAPYAAARWAVERPNPPRSEAAAGGLDLMQFIQFAIGFANRRYARDEYDLATFAPTAAPSPTPVPPFLTQSSPSDRWRASSWVLWRDGGGSPDAATVGRLGGSQAGVRIEYALSDSKTSRLATYARMTSALQRPAAPEAAAGLAFQPSRQIPVAFAVERRIALGGGARNANAGNAGVMGRRNSSGDDEAAAPPPDVGRRTRPRADAGSGVVLGEQGPANREGA